MALVSSQNNMKKEATAGAIMALRVRQLRSTDTTVTELEPAGASPNALLVSVVVD